MAETVLLRQVVDDLTFIRSKIIKLEVELEEINNDLHEVRPAYLKKLEKIKRGKFHRYASVEDLRRDIEG